MGFNIDLPLNFSSPYKATSIIEFWRRWHMTLSRFLRDYLYIPLGGNRRGPWRRNINLMITMVLGGLWHGAAWTFVIWGALHGLFLLVNHAFRAYAPSALGARAEFRVFAWILTLGCVVVAWVFFRADSLEVAVNLLKAMASPWTGVRPVVPVVAAEPRYVTVLIAIGFAVALWCPNAQQMFRLPFHPRIEGAADRPGSPVEPEPDLPWARFLTWRPSLAGAVVYGGALAAFVLLFVRTTSFLYFQF